VVPGPPPVCHHDHDCVPCPPPVCHDHDRDCDDDHGHMWQAAPTSAAPSNAGMASLPVIGGLAGGLI